MTAPAKEGFSRWLPTLIAIVGLGVQLAVLSAWIGRLDQRLATVERHAADKVLHVPLSETLAMFVSRAEYARVTAQREQELSDIKKSIDSVNSKLDRLIERRGE